MSPSDEASASGRQPARPRAADGGPEDATPLYAAERTLERALDRAAAGDRLIQAAGSTLVMPDGERRFSTDAHLRTYVAWLSRGPTARRHGCSGPPEVRTDRRRVNAVYRHDPASRHDATNRHDGVIMLPDSTFGRRELTVLHEFAHHLTPTDGHGPPFVRALVELVAEVLGPEAALLLTEQLRMHEVT